MYLAPCDECSGYGYIYDADEDEGIDCSECEGGGDMCLCEDCNELELPEYCS